MNEWQKKFTDDLRKFLEEKKMKRTQVILITIITVIVVIFIGTLVIATPRNTAIRLDNQVATNKANINKEEQRRVDLFNNLVDAVKSYDKYESSTLDKITEARSQASKGQVDKAEINLASVVEKYPELKSQKNYQQAMTEFSVTDNRIADYQEAYNNSVRSYNNYVQSYPANALLNLTGYNTQHYQQTNIKVDNQQARNLFGK